MPAAKSNNGLTIKLSSLKLNPNNPQKFNDLSKLENSIKEFPKMMELRPLVYDPDNNNMILGGNKRLVCLQNMGYKEIPKSWAVSAKDLTDEEKKRFIIADNVPFGEWDEDVLMEFYSEDELEDWGCKVEFNNEISDINEVNEFNESVNFIIKCKSIDQLEQLQSKLNCNTTKINYKDFLIKVGL